MYCNNCGLVLKEEDRYCRRCGFPRSAGGGFSHDARGEMREGVKAWHRRAYTEGDSGTGSGERRNPSVGSQPVELNWKMIFSGIFKRHTKEEAEEIFICGTKGTTPSPCAAGADWPRPWLYARVFLLFALSFFLLWVCCTSLKNVNAMPGLIVVGAFLASLSSLIFFVELNAWRDVSIYEVIKLFLVGGCASLVTTLLLFSILQVNETNFIGAVLTSIIEECGKVVVIYFFIKRLKNVHLLNAMLIGACVGAGFAAFESSGYSFRILMDEEWDGMINDIFLRGVLTPCGHVAWGATSGAALVVASKARKTHSGADIFSSPTFLRLFSIPVTLHMIWSSPLSKIAADIHLVPTLLAIFVWVVVLIFSDMGLTEVSRVEEDERAGGSAGSTRAGLPGNL